MPTRNIPGAGVDDLATPFSEDVRRTGRSYRQGVNTVSGLNAKNVPGVAGRVLDRTAAAMGFRAVEKAAPAATTAGKAAGLAKGAVSMLNPLNPTTAAAAGIKTTYDGFNTNTDDYRARMGLDPVSAEREARDGDGKFELADVGDYAADFGVRAFGVFQDMGNNVTLGGADRLSNYMAGNGFNRSPAPAPAQAQAPAAPSTPANPQAARDALTKANNATDPSRQAPAVNPADVARGYRRDGNSFTGVNAAGELSNASVVNTMPAYTKEQYAKDSAATDNLAYANYMNAGYDPAEAKHLASGGSLRGFREAAAQASGDTGVYGTRPANDAWGKAGGLEGKLTEMLDKGAGMKYGGNMVDTATEGLARLEQIKANAAEGAADRAAKAATTGKDNNGFRDQLALAQFDLDKQKFGYQQKKDSAEMERQLGQAGVDQANKNREANTKTYQDRLAADFTDASTGKLDQAKIGEFNRLATPLAQKVFGVKNLQDLDEGQYQQLSTANRLMELTRNNAGMLPGFGQFKEGASLEDFMPVADEKEPGKLKTRKGPLGHEYLVLRNGSEVNLDDLNYKGGAPVGPNAFRGQRVSSGYYGPATR